MSINLITGEGRGNRIMAGQNHCRNPFISCRVPPGSLHAAMVELRSTILSPDDSVAQPIHNENCCLKFDFDSNSP